jgi:hypothetical protein
MFHLCFLIFLYHCLNVLIHLSYYFKNCIIFTFTHMCIHCSGHLLPNPQTHFWGNSSILSSSCDILSPTWSNLLARVSTGFYNWFIDLSVFLVVLRLKPRTSCSSSGVSFRKPSSSCRLKSAVHSNKLL